MNLAADFELDYREYLRSRREAQPAAELEGLFLGPRPDGRAKAAGPCGDFNTCLDACLDSCGDSCGDNIFAYGADREPRS